MLVPTFRTPEKEPRHQVKRLFDIKSPQLKREMGALLGPAIVSSNLVQAPENGDDIFPSMLAAIAAAQRTITLETYIYWAGTVGEQFAGVLIERARAEVRTHVMLDCIGCGKISPALVTRMKHAGIEVEQYHPLRWYTLGTLNNRTHRKVLVIDGRVGFTGAWKLRINGAGTRGTANTGGTCISRLRDRSSRRCRQHFWATGSRPPAMSCTGMTISPRCRRRALRRCRCSSAPPKGGSDSTRLMYLTAITAATRSIDIEAAYFIPDPLMILELVGACA